MSGSRGESRLARFRGFPVPGANVLADIATENPSVQVFGDGLGNRAPMLDRPVAQATVRVELIRHGEGLCRAGVETTRAGPAVSVFPGRVVRQLTIDEQR